MTYNYTDTFRLAMELSFERAKELGAVEVTPDLLLYGILKSGNAPSYEYLKTKGLDPDKLLSDYEHYVEEHTPRSASDVAPSLGERSRMAISEAVRLCDNQEAGVSPVHLMKALVESDNDTYLKPLIQSQEEESKAREKMNNDKIFKAMKDAFDRLMSPLSAARPMPNPEEDEEDEREETSLGDMAHHASGEEARPKQKRKKSRSRTPMLDQFGRDITALARQGKLDPVIGRQNEIERIGQILGRRRKSNPILIGEPGVGKTSLVEGLALRIVAQEVPQHLIAKRLVELDLSAVVAGTKYRGQFEERIKEILEELESTSDVIIYIDEIHTMVGAGGGGSAMDAANMLKPALARGGIQCIGATTLEEYRKHIEKDGALERRFQPLIVEPNTASETLEILHQLRSRYEDYHHVHYTDAALEAMVQMADRYVNHRYFPDKAIDLMDEAGSRLGSRQVAVEELGSLSALEEEHAGYMKRKLDAIRDQKFELAASFRNKERELELAIQEAKEKLQAESRASYYTVDKADIAHIVAQLTGVPVQNITDGELERLKTLESNLKAKVIGQDQAVELVSSSIKRSRLGLRDPKRPIGSFLFLGSTGVGKTYLVKCLAEELFGSTDALIRVDMSEYMEKFSVSRLVGAPPGYIGHDEGGQLTEQVRRRPYSIVLFDEIEKAHSDVYNLLLQLLDEGHLTDSYGRKVDFRNTIIVITSNVGSREARSFGRGIGYQEEFSTAERKSDIIRKSLNKTFSPEFLNRLDEIITFETLGAEELRKIVELELSSVRTRLLDLGYSLELDDLALELLSKQAYHPEYGARPLRRTLQRELEDRLTDLILDGEMERGDILSLTAKDGKIVAKRKERA